MKENCEKKIPMQEDAMKAEMQKIKQECLIQFQNKALHGEMKSSARG